MLVLWAVGPWVLCLQVPHVEQPEKVHSFPLGHWEISQSSCMGIDSALKRRMNHWGSATTMVARTPGEREC